MAQQLFRMSDPQPLLDALAQHESKESVMVLYQPTTTAQHLFTFGALALQSGIKRLQLIHPPTRKGP